MSESPYAPPQIPVHRRLVTITNAKAFQMPHKCVVCGADGSELHSYTQDHLPLVGFGFGLVRTTQVAIPYCDQHRDAFEKRFRKLRMAQAAAYVILVIWGVTAFVEPVRVAFGWAPQAGGISYAFGGVLFLFLIVSIFCIKPFLYDAFIKCSGNRIRIKSRSRTFIQNVIAHNQAIVR